jgi:hypothetical protein
MELPSLTRHRLARALRLAAVLCGFAAVGLPSAVAQNPILPSWEYVPDGEPRVFGDRVYLYGSHDRAGSKTFCDYRLVVWSAPLSDLSNWRMDSESFRTRDTENGKDDVDWSDNELYAPDVVEKDGKYYLYFYIVGAPGGVAVSDTPGGPFKLVSKYEPPPGQKPDFGGWGQYIDPGVLVDTDGRVYLYWGYQRSYMAELDPTNMYRVLPDTLKTDIIPTTDPYRFFEACSPRKIGDTYYLIYARGGELVYTTSRSPTGPFAFGGVIVRNGGDSPGGNIHGSIAQLNGQWYVFYHRMTNNTIFSRRACVERIEIRPDGSIAEVEQTSLGFKESLDPYRTWSADIVCVLRGGNYVTEIDRDTHPVIRNRNRSVAGYRYFEFGAEKPEGRVRFEMSLKRVSGAGTVEIWLDEVDKGEKIGSIQIGEQTPSDTWTTVSTQVSAVKGRRAVFLRFVGDGFEAEFKSFGFAEAEQPGR